MNKQDHIPMTQQERDDDQEFQRKINLNPHDFVSYALPRTEEPYKKTPNEVRALMYLRYGTIDGSRKAQPPENWSREIYFKIKRGEI